MTRKDQGLSVIVIVERLGEFTFWKSSLAPSDYNNIPRCLSHSLPVYPYVQYLCAG
jgi:hypothetical protein